MVNVWCGDVVDGGGLSVMGDMPAFASRACGTHDAIPACPLLYFASMRAPFRAPHAFLCLPLLRLIAHTRLAASPLFSHVARILPLAYIFALHRLSAAHCTLRMPRLRRARSASCRIFSASHGATARKTRNA